MRRLELPPEKVRELAVRFGRPEDDILDVVRMFDIPEDSGCPDMFGTLDTGHSDHVRGYNGWWCAWSYNGTVVYFTNAEPVVTTMDDPDFRELLSADYSGDD